MGDGLGRGIVSCGVAHVGLGNSEIVVEGFIARREGRQLYHEGEIRNAAGDLLARGQGRFVVIDPEKQKLKP